uniref:ATP synthase F1 subunit gamma n=1 Tax=Ophirina amphinema TaxID=2108040 RepID=A0A348AYP6_9EUKA|nr:ATP synthase F1 subunit gamma [Ophirina amphinema]
MASTKEFKNRLRSISSVQKITKAMKMVAASKLRQVQSTTENSRPSIEGVGHLLQNIPFGSESNDLIVPISSDRGLCGGVNSVIVREVRKSVRENTLAKQVFCVGEKGKDALKSSNPEILVGSISDITKKSINFTVASVIVDALTSLSFDRSTVVFNKFKSVISQEVRSLELPSSSHLSLNLSLFDEYEFESEKSELMSNLYEFAYALLLHNAILENATSEQGARMSAMDNASRNASDMLDALNLKYNKARQAGITQELIEIVSCASAVAA